jgi:hypothetical protein
MRCSPPGAALPHPGWVARYRPASAQPTACRHWVVTEEDWLTMLQPRVAPVRRHLPSAAGRVRRRAHGLQQHLLHRVAQREAQRTVAIVGIEPVVAGLQSHARRHQKGLVAGAGDLEKDLLLPLEQDLAIVRAARQVHQPVHPDQLLRLQGQRRKRRCLAQY